MDFMWEKTNNFERACQAIAGFKNSDIIAFDVETYGLNFLTDKLHSFSLADKETAWYFYGDIVPELMPKLQELFDSDEVSKIIGHNIGFDMHFLARHNVFISERKIVDTMYMAWILDENQFVGLKPLSKKWLKIEDDLPQFKDLIKERKKELGLKRMGDVSIDDLDLETFATYAAKDTRLTFDLFMVLSHHLEKSGLSDLYYAVEIPFLCTLWEIEENGMPVDRVLLEKMRLEFGEERERLLKKWETLAPGVNINSDDQLANLFHFQLKMPVVNTTKSGAPSTDSLALMRLKNLYPDNELVDTVTQYRKVDKFFSTYIVSILEKTSSEHPIIHSDFNRTGTVTGRLSSGGGVNLQNLPTKTELGGNVREAFIALPGHKLIVADFSQLELRILAHYARDPIMIGAFNEGKDPHQITADMVGVSRKIGKTLNFAWAYGTGPRTLATTIEKALGVRPAESDAKQWLRQFDVSYPALTNWKYRVLQYAKRLGYVKTLGGRYRRLPEITSRVGSERSRAERQAVNSIIQGSAADIMMFAMLEMRPYVKYFGGKILAQVHDEIVVSVPEQYAETVKEKIVKAMKGQEKRFEMRVSLEVSANIGNNWAECK